ncbi:MAG: DUF1778 domain-containing protein [Clostridiales bacterium]|nr:DUF1778 domain-containing protein [Clostridiales bacterium]
MSHKSRDMHGRWRNITVAFRASEEENRLINEAVALSGLTKQEYIITKLQNRDVVVVGNPRVFKALKTKMNAIYEELNRIKEASEISDQLIETINLVSSIYARMIENK